jgi:hypothetical protein
LAAISLNWLASKALSVSVRTLPAAASAASIQRFAALHCYDNVPPQRLPPALRPNASAK